MGYLCASEDGRPGVIVIMNAETGDTDAWCPECMVPALSSILEAMGTTVGGSPASAWPSIDKAFKDGLQRIEMHAPSARAKDYAFTEMRKVYSALESEFDNAEPGTPEFVPDEQATAAVLDSVADEPPY